MDVELGEFTDVPLPCRRALSPIQEEPAKLPDCRPEAPSFSAVGKLHRRLTSETAYCVVSVVTLIVVVGLCVLCYLFCVPCLFGIIAISCCLCPWMSYFNIPLWLSILLLVYTGWHFTAHVMGITAHFNYT